MYPKEDFGLNVSVMKWYQTDPEGIFNFLKEKWDEAHEHISSKDKKAIVFIETRPSGEHKKKPTVELLPQKKRYEKKEGTVKIIE